MIRADDVGVMINGNTQTIMLDFIFIVRSMRETLKEDFGEEVADKLITDMGKMAYLDPNDDEAYDEAFDKIVEESPFMEWKGEHNNGK